MTGQRRRECELDNCEPLKRIVGLDEVSFHASGTEAVMAAVRLVRFNTKRRLIVTFSGACHGWWDGVQPGIGSERDIGDVLTLKEMDRSSLAAIRARAHDIDAVLLTSEIRKTHSQSSAYASWLRKLREVCTNAGVPLVFDEIYSGFRIAPGGAQEYFGVRADMVLYGKTVAGGMPIGIVCGKTELMRRFDPDHPMRIAYVVGTFSAHPLVMGAMSEFLRWLETPKAALLYEAADANAAHWVTERNRALTVACAPVEVTHLGTIWTVVFKRPSRFNWLMQYYLRAEGVCMSWVGTGRCLFSMDFAELDYASLRAKLVRAATRMLDDKWWLSDAEQPDAAHAVRARVTKDLVKSVLQPPRPVRAFYREVMRRKQDDHVASHSNRLNQVMHFVSSSVFIVCYGLMFFDLVTAMRLGLGALFLRQTGHALIEPPCHERNNCCSASIPAARRGSSWVSVDSAGERARQRIRHGDFRMVADRRHRREAVVPVHRRRGVRPRAVVDQAPRAAQRAHLVREAPDRSVHGSSRVLRSFSVARPT